MLFWKLVLVSIRSQMQYSASFLMLFAGHFLTTFVDIIGLWVLFDRFHIIQGWTLTDISLNYGIIQTGFALAEAFSRGFDTFQHMIKQGEFDRVLLRPISPLLQIAVQEVQLMRLGRLVQGLCVLIWSIYSLSIPLVSLNILIILCAILGGAALFYGLFVIQATLCFWTIETLELMNIATYGGLQMSLYPMSIYKVSLRWIFTFLIPLSCVSYYPISAVLKHTFLPPWVSLIIPLAGLAFLFLSCQLWRLGIKSYASTGN